MSMAARMLLSLLFTISMHALACCGKPLLAVDQPGRQTHGREEAVQRGSMEDPGQIGLQLPEVVYDAVVTGPATAAEARESAAVLARSTGRPWAQLGADTDTANSESRSPGEPGRALLHGRRRKSAYTQCPLCTLIRCNRNRPPALFCTGHCKKRSRLFECTTDFRAVSRSKAFGCDIDPLTLPVGTLKPVNETAVVTAPAPFIGCANTTSFPDGCPAPGFTSERVRAGTAHVTVIASSCVQHRYTPTCTEHVGLGWPYTPFGYCECTLRHTDGSVSSGPCSTSQLDWSGTGGAEETSVRVFTIRNVTRTTFGIIEQGDVPAFNRVHRFETARQVIIGLDVYESYLFTSTSLELTREGPLRPEGERARAWSEGESSAMAAAGDNDDATDDYNVFESGGFFDTLAAASAVVAAVANGTAFFR